jgi:hypothetical protein
MNHKKRHGANGDPIVTRQKLASALTISKKLAQENLPCKVSNPWKKENIAVRKRHDKACIRF